MKLVEKILIIVLFGLLFLILVVFALFYKSDLSRDQLSRYINDESGFVTLPNGATVHFRDEGHQNGPVLLMLHGGFGSLHNWEDWIPYLEGDLRLVSLDLPGHGLTGKLPEDIYTRATMNETVDLLMQMLEIEKFSIAGNSMGGGLALQYALDYPGKVESLILIGSEGIPNSEDGYDASMFTDEEILSPDDPGYSKLSKSEIFLSKFIGPAVIKGALNQLIADKSLLTRDFVDYFGRIIRFEGNREANILMFRQWFASDADPRDLESRLDEINIPVLYMHGSEDILVPENVARQFVELLPNCELVIYENSGHMSMIEKPKETAIDILLFFSELDNYNH